MFEIIFYIIYWHYAYGLVERYNRNFIGFLHASLYVIMYKAYTSDGLKLLEDLQLFSSSYFYYDIYVLYNRCLKKYTVTDIALIVHHIIAIYMLQMFSEECPHDMIGYVLYLGELSNIPGYFSYYLIKEKHFLASRVQLFQTIVYSFIRVVVLTSFTIGDLHKPYPYYYLFLFSLIYLMGIIWSYKLLKKNVYTPLKENIRRLILYISI